MTSPPIEFKCITLRIFILKSPFGFTNFLNSEVFFFVEFFRSRCVILVHKTFFQLHQVELGFLYILYMYQLYMYFVFLSILPHICILVLFFLANKILEKKQVLIYIYALEYQEKNKTEKYTTNIYIISMETLVPPNATF